MMRKLFLILHFLFIVWLLHAQTPDSLIGELKTINKKLASEPCNTGRGNIISNRAMNIFLSNKVGYFLSESDNLSLYKNSATFDAADGTLAINHNLYSPKGADDRVSSLTSFGIKANITDAFAAGFTGRSFDNQLGFVLKQTWIANSTTYFNSCTNETPARMSQKKIMDAHRAAILHQLEAEIKKKEADFETALNSIDPVIDVPSEGTQAAKSTARQKFYTDLREEYEYKFALLQSEVLAKTFNYNLVAVHWTSISLYIPLIREKFEVAPLLVSRFEDKHAYPLHFNVSHTRLWESIKYGRFFVTLSGEIFWNNSKESYGLYKINYSDYKDRGGIDTIRAVQLGANGIYIGRYEDFFTPLIKGQLVYFPPGSHFGISFLMEQNFGNYNALNARLGIPIVLINKKAEPAMNFEFQVRFFDISNKINPGYGPANKTSIGVTIGAPSSKIAY